MTVRFSDIDLAGHVHNAQYLNYFEAGRMAFLGEFVPTEHEWFKESLILARNEVNYLQPIRLADEVVIDVSCQNIGQKSFTLAYDMFIVNGEQETPCCTGTSTMVCYNYQEKRSIKIPEHWRNELEKRK